MDWYVDATDGNAVRELRREFGDYLRRHGNGHSDVDAAELAFAEVVGNIARHATGPAWINLDWSGESPVLTAHDLGPGFTPRIELPDDPMSQGGRGLFLVAHLTEVTPEKIVLGNRRCPFGDAVRRAPTLCRMTSSVFGGIAARNAGGASVQLEERIAVGDPECRVTVGLGPQNGRAGFAHAYG